MTRRDFLGATLTAAGAIALSDQLFAQLPAGVTVPAGVTDSFGCSLCASSWEFDVRQNVVSLGDNVYRPGPVQFTARFDGYLFCHVSDLCRVPGDTDCYAFPDACRDLLAAQAATRRGEVPDCRTVSLLSLAAFLRAARCHHQGASSNDLYPQSWGPGIVLPYTVSERMCGDPLGQLVLFGSAPESGEVTVLPGAPGQRAREIRRVVRHGNSTGGGLGGDSFAGDGRVQSG